MREKGTKLSSNSIFYFLIIAALVVVFISASIGEKQDEIYLQDRVKLAQAQKYLSEGNAALAEPIFTELLGRYPESYPLFKLYGDNLAVKGDYQEAVTYYRKAQKEYPFVVKEAGFSLKMGELLYQIKEYQEAAKYLQIAKFIESDASNKEKITQLLQNITNEVGR